ncbi:MAG: DUF2147 domain-containing protein [Bacteroidota bacterium]
MIARFIFSLFSILLAVSSYSQESIFGKWKTVDDETGKVKSIVEILSEGDKASGKVLELFREEGEDPDPICEECSGKRKNEKIIGMQIIEDLEKDGDEWSGGEILDPENGKIYRCKIWREGENLKVRGYLYFFYRTQTWLPL